MQNLAVFTGDIVRSGALEARELSNVFTALEATARSIADWHDSMAPFARFRGDGWQMALPPRYALRAALSLRAAVRATGKGRDTRIGIGIGAGQITSGNLGDADGPAFVNSGRALDGMQRQSLFAAPDTSMVLRAALPLADRIAQGWTPKQAQMTLHLLAPLPPTHETLATQMGITRQLIQKQADAASVAALIESCEIYEAS